MINNSISKEYIELINIVSHILKEKIEIYSFGKNLDYVLFYKLAVKNSVANTVADVVCNCDSVPDEIKQRFKKQKSMIISQRVLGDKVLNDL